MGLRSSILADYTTNENSVETSGPTPSSLSCRQLLLHALRHARAATALAKSLALPRTGADLLRTPTLCHCRSPFLGWVVESVRSLLALAALSALEALATALCPLQATPLLCLLRLCHDFLLLGWFRLRCSRLRLHCLFPRFNRCLGLLWRPEASTPPRLTVTHVPLNTCHADGALLLLFRQLLDLPRVLINMARKVGSRQAIF
jgi:hypothetical protein